MEECFAAAAEKVKGISRYERRLKKCRFSLDRLAAWRERKIVRTAEGATIPGESFELDWGETTKGLKLIEGPTAEAPKLLEIRDCAKLVVTLSKLDGSGESFRKELTIPSGGDFISIPLGTMTFTEEDCVWISAGDRMTRALATPSALKAGIAYRAFLQARIDGEACQVRSLDLKKEF